MIEEIWYRCPKCDYRILHSEPNLRWSLIHYQPGGWAESVELQSCPRCLFAALRELAPDMVRVEESGG